jgi:hypothetical protein
MATIKEKLIGILQQEYQVSKEDAVFIVDNNPATLEMIDSRGIDSIYAGAMLLNWKLETNKNK